MRKHEIFKSDDRECTKAFITSTRTPRETRNVMRVPMTGIAMDENGKETIVDSRIRTPISHDDLMDVVDDWLDAGEYDWHGRIRQCHWISISATQHEHTSYLDVTLFKSAPMDP